MDKTVENFEKFESSLNLEFLGNSETKKKEINGLLQIKRTTLLTLEKNDIFFYF